MQYAELNVRLEPRQGGGYEVLAWGESGEAVGTFVLPFSDLELENFVLRVGRTRRGTRRLESPEMQRARDFGGRLFDALLSAQVRDLYRDCYASARGDGKGLRVKLSLGQAPELTDVPWEYLYDSPSFLSISQFTPVVRYLDLPRARPPLEISFPLRVLAMISAPSGEVALDVEDERRKVELALRGRLIEQELVEITWLEKATLRELQHELRHGPYHVFHFIGHGAYDPGLGESILLFEDEAGRGSLVSGTQLGTILSDHTSLRLAVLNACEGARTSRDDPFSGVAASLVQHGLPAVIAMQFEITDRAAIIFAEEFYAALVDGLPVDAALAETRKAIYGDGNDIEWGTPVLFMRVRDGRVFDVPKPASDFSRGQERDQLRAGEQAEREGAERAAGERAEAERLTEEQAEREEAERAAGDRAEAERLAREQAEREEAERAAGEQAEAERLAREQANRDGPELGTRDRALPQPPPGGHGVRAPGFLGRVGTSRWLIGAAASLTAIGILAWFLWPNPNPNPSPNPPSTAAPSISWHVSRGNEFGGPGHQEVKAIAPVDSGSAIAVGFSSIAPLASKPVVWRYGGRAWHREPDLSSDAYGQLEAVARRGSSVVIAGAAGRGRYSTAAAVWTRFGQGAWQRRCPSNPGEVCSSTPAVQVSAKIWGLKPMPDGFVAVGRSARSTNEHDLHATVWTSRDGLRWHTRYLDDEAGTMQAISRIGDRLVAVGNVNRNGGTAMVWRGTADGSHWQKVSEDDNDDLGAGNLLNGVAARGSTAVAVGYRAIRQCQDLPPTRALAFQSTNSGAIWQLGSSAAFRFPGGKALGVIPYGNGFVAFGYGRRRCNGDRDSFGAAWTSGDGQRWTLDQGAPFFRRSGRELNQGALVNGGIFVGGDGATRLGDPIDEYDAEIWEGRPRR